MYSEEIHPVTFHLNTCQHFIAKNGAYVFVFVTFLLSNTAPSCSVSHR